MKLKLIQARALQPREQELLRHVRVALRRSQLKVDVDRKPYESELKGQVDRLDLLARATQETPSLYGEQRIGPRRRDIHSLIETLSQSSAHNFELYMPMRALIGRTLLMAKINFFRLIRHVVSDAMEPSDKGQQLSMQCERILCTCIYTKIAEEILSAVASDEQLAALPRKKAVAMLCQIWENRLTYQVADFFPILQSVWEARRRTKTVFGTLTGIAEMFDLIRAGCDDRFIDLFSQDQITQDQCQAFQEFLFLASGPELDRLMNHVRSHRSVEPAEAARLLESPLQRFDLSSQAAEKMYESFRRRHLAATARRHSPGVGAGRTAEEYIMLHLIGQMDLDALISEPTKPQELLPDQTQ